MDAIFSRCICFVVGYRCYVWWQTMKALPHAKPEHKQERDTLKDWLNLITESFQGFVGDWNIGVQKGVAGIFTRKMRRYELRRKEIKIENLFFKANIVITIKKNEH